MTDIHCHLCLYVSLPLPHVHAVTLQCGLKCFVLEKSTSRSHDHYAIFMVAELVFYPQGLITCEDANQSSAMAMAVQQQQMQSQGELAMMAAAMTPGGAQASTGVGGGEHKMSGQT